MWPFSVRTHLCDSTNDEECAKRLGELLKAEFGAVYEGLSVVHGGSQEITTYSFRLGSGRVRLELETYIGATLIAPKRLTAEILRVAKSCGLNFAERSGSDPV